MTDRVLDGLRIAVLAADGFEQVEVMRPMQALEKHGARVDVVSLRPGSIQGMNLLVPGKKLRVDHTVSGVEADDYDGLHLPGGFVSPDFLRQSGEALELVGAFEAAGKPITTICHGPWVLVSAGLVRNRRLTSWPGIKDDVVNAGGVWVDEAVVHDANWLSSRGPQDLPAFDRAIVEHFAAFAGRAAPPAPRDVRWGPLLVGTAAVAAAGYAVQRRRRGEGADAGAPRATPPPARTNGARHDADTLVVVK
jgi:protease I